MAYLKPPAFTRCLVSPFGESDWVRNLRAASRGELSSKGRTEAFHASEIPVDERGAIIARYREVAPSSVEPCFRKLPDAGDHPVFRVDQEPSPTATDRC